ncbi:MAG TPA: glycosyltransferase family 4 protein [Bacillota bacterium]|nr:glycosyltransferase family 4 protein [Bacillota bacterium]
MRIIFLAQYLVSPSQPGSGRPWQTASHLGSQGHKVKVLFSNIDYNTGLSRKGGFPAEDTMPEGVKLKNVPNLGLGKSLLSRLVQYSLFACLAFFRGLLFSKVDVVLATSPPLFVGIAGYLLALCKGARFVLEIRDPWPAAPVYFGMLKNPLVIRLLLMLEKFLYKKAALIVAVTPGMKQHIIEKGTDSRKVKVITTGYDPEIYTGYPTPRWQKPGNATVIYTGAMGVINETELLMDVVELLKEQPGIKFQFIGSGVQKGMMEKRAREKNLTNVEFLPPVPRKQIGSFLSQAQIAIVATRPGFYSEVGLHNKMFDYLGAGLPVVISGTGDIRRVIDAGQCGLVVEPGDPNAFAAAVLYLAYNPELCALMGTRAKQYMEDRFHRAKLLARYEKALVNLFGEEAKWR